jgi:hypothetical protein
MTTREELLERAATTAAAVRARAGIPSLRLDPTAIPKDLQFLLPHAQVLGIGDDPARGEIVEEVDEEYLRSVATTVGGCLARLSEWLQEVEAKGPPYPKEFVAYSCLLYAIESVSSE